MPEAIALSTKYFIADSAAMPESRSKAISAYTDSASSSTPMYTVNRLLAETSTKMPEQRRQGEHVVFAAQNVALIEVGARIQEHHGDDEKPASFNT